MKNFYIPNIGDEKSILKTIRIKLVTLNKIEELAKKNNISVNRLINECIEYALNNLPEEYFDNNYRLKQIMKEKESLWNILVF